MSGADGGGGVVRRLYGGAGPELGKGRQMSERGLEKAPTGIAGFDAITRGGLPRGRFTVVVGGPGTGKTVFALNGLVTGVRQGEPAIFAAFEEDVAQVLSNAASFDWGLADIPDRQLHFFDARLPTSVLEGGDFDLVATLAILEAQAREMGARRIVFDGIDVLLGLLDDPGAVRREVFRLRAWLARTGLTGVVTAKCDLGTGALTHEYSFLSYLADCMVELRQWLVTRTAVRGIRVAKYRGTAHSSDEFSFVVGPSGIHVAAPGLLPVTPTTTAERVSTGVARLDSMLGGGYYRGSSILISGRPGTGKTILTGAFSAAACARGERVVLATFDEPCGQLLRNLRSVGVDLAPHVESGALVVLELRSRRGAPEAYVVDLHAQIERHRPRHVVVDPISAMSHTGPVDLAETAAVELLEQTKGAGITLLSTALVDHAGMVVEQTPVGLSTLADTWLHVTNMSQAGERNRTLSIIKSRGMQHSNQVRELVLSSAGIDLTDVYTAGGEVLMGTLRWEREQEERRAQLARGRMLEREAREARLAAAEARARIDALAHAVESHEADAVRLEAQLLADHDERSERAREIERRRTGAARRFAEVDGDE